MRRYPRTLRYETSGISKIPPLSVASIILIDVTRLMSPSMQTRSAKPSLGTAAWKKLVSAAMNGILKVSIALFLGDNISYISAVEVSQLVIRNQLPPVRELVVNRPISKG